MHIRVVAQAWFRVPVGVARLTQHAANNRKPPTTTTTTTSTTTATTANAITTTTSPPFPSMGVGRCGKRLHRRTYWRASPTLSVTMVQFVLFVATAREVRQEARQGEMTAHEARWVAVKWLCLMSCVCSHPCPPWCP